MAIDGIMLHTITGQLKQLEGGKIGKIQNVSADEFCLSIHVPGLGTRRLIINIHSSTNRIYLSAYGVASQNDPGSFVMVLRKYISQAIITRIEQAGFDRIIRIELAGHNELGDRCVLKLYAELMGKYANLILVDEKDQIVDAAKRIPVYENSQRLIHPGAAYALPPASGKASVLNPGQLDFSESLVKQLEGFSPLLSREVLFRLKEGESFDEIIQTIFESRTLYVYDQKNFHVLPLKHLESSPREYELMQGLGQLYSQKEESQRLQDSYGDVSRTIQSNLKRLKKKLPKLEETLAQSRDYARYQMYGDLLFVYESELEKAPVVTCPSLEDDSPVQIPLDMRYSIKDNANLCYKKYHKLKRSQALIEEQIQQAQQELAYFEQLESQFGAASLNDAAEIKEELIASRYLRAKSRSRVNRRKKAPSFLELQLPDAQIFVGKNNIQNNYLTHTLARKNDLWFHVKDYHGTHVILKCEEASESLIRLCASLAAYFSGSRHSSSVPVDYTQVSQLKKVPGSKMGLVTMKRYKTIYIDPDEETLLQTIAQYRKKR